jgi:ABC-type polar amino acid transport system ATPase subunit
MLRAFNIEKCFSGRSVLTRTTLDVPEASITVLLGPNGAGKSTLFKCMALVDPPDAGEIVVGDRAFKFNHGRAQPMTGVWPDLTAVFQGLHLWPHLTLRENIFGPIRWERRAHDSIAADKLFSDFGIGHILDRLPNRCSGGERQKAALARAILLRPRFLLLDEPTASLDVDFVQVLAEYLRGMSNAGAAILVVTHMPGFARSIANYVAFMESGRVVEAGGTEVLDSPTNETLRRFIALY